MQELHLGQSWVLEAVGNAPTQLRLGIMDMEAEDSKKIVVKVFTYGHL